MDLERQRNQKSNCQHPLDHWKSKRVSEKYLCMLYWLCQSLCVCVDHDKLWKMLQEVEKKLTTLPASCKTCMQVKKQQLEPDMEQWTCSKLGKEYIKVVHCHPAYLSHMYSPWNFPGQHTEMGSLSLLQGIFPTQGSNPGLPHCRQILYVSVFNLSWGDETYTQEK